MGNINRYAMYVDTLENAPYAQGVLYIARQVQRDTALKAYERACLMDLAAKLYEERTGHDIRYDL